MDFIKTKMWNSSEAQSRFGMKPTWNQEIPQHWVDQGLTMDDLKAGYKVVHAYLLVGMIICIINYVICWKVRKNIHPMKLIGEIPMTKFEKYAFACQLGREPAINFVNSTLVTNDRAYVVLRLILGLTSTLGQTFVGASTPLRGLNYPIALILTVYTNFNRKLIILGFGSKMQTLNKVHSYFFNCQLILAVFITISNWTQWFGLFPFRDMSRKPDLSHNLMAIKEFSPLILLLVDLLWLETRVHFAGVWHAMTTMTSMTLLLIAGQKQQPQAVLAPVDQPARTLPQTHIAMIAIPTIQLAISLLCDLKIWVLRQLPVIGERVRLRESLIENFRKRQAFTKHFPVTRAMRRQTATTNEIFKKFGRVSQKQSILRRLQQRNQQRNQVGDRRISQTYGRRRMSVANALMTVESLDSFEYD
ncbi:Oidioi.mRNA.OKI2018_I69.PAR.g9684.t1.cds [Oikopleura dioica]|uniref:Oidioi.mRNA.OKI2018_I69.PAR.g9684.t1.cds n=1 Tax=Oikopleura dioica TaxID=34765 RepID=A0ABN7RMP8_OIKDI|nr:Oidioi.mRNA.OKI2018_I69.PAR.g9684.t1.cds [Oikopleura dioica]